MAFNPNDKDVRKDMRIHITNSTIEDFDWPRI